jgi:hypothetical protein
VSPTEGWRERWGSYTHRSGEGSSRDGNSGTGVIFYPWVAPVSDPNQDGYVMGIFPPAGNPTGTRYFTIARILGCEQVKMCSFCYINYDLF